MAESSLRYTLGVRVSSVYTLVAESFQCYTLVAESSLCYTLVAESSQCYILGVRVSAVYTVLAEFHLYILWWPSLPSVILLWQSLICLYSCGRVFRVLYSLG